MPVFYPSTTVRLTLRFDEGTETQVLEQNLQNDVAPPGLETTTADEDTEQVLEELRQDLSQILSDRGIIPAEDFNHRLSENRRRRDLAQRRAGDRTSLPAALSAAPPDDLTVIGNVLPLSADIQRNGLRMADTATVTIAHRDAPFDPRAIRSAAIEITMGTVSAEDFARGSRGERREDGSLYSVVQRVPADSPPAPGTTRFIGFVDDWSVDRGEGDVVELQCRDLSALLVDQKLPPGLAIDQSLPVDEAVRNLLNLFPSMRGTEVVWTGEDAAPTLESSLPASRRSRRGGRSRRARSGGENMTVWDHIVETCSQVGIVPLFVDNQLQIIPPRTFYTGDRARVMVYGRNIKSLTFTRKMGGTKVPTVEIRSYDPSIGRVRWARYPVAAGVASGVFGETDPPRASRASSVSPSGVADDKILTFNRQTTDPVVMEQTAEQIWHEIGRKEIEGTFTTSDIAAWIRPEDTSEPIQPQEQEVGDLLSMKAGDAVEMLVASVGPSTREPIASSNELESMAQEARAQYLQRLGWSREVAVRFARLQDAASFQTVFRVQHVELGFDMDTGFTVSADFINFLEVRETP